MLNWRAVFYFFPFIRACAICPIKKAFLSHPTLFYCFSVLMQYVFAYIQVNRVHLRRDVLLLFQVIRQSDFQAIKQAKKKKSFNQIVWIAFTRSLKCVPHTKYKSLFTYYILIFLCSLYLRTCQYRMLIVFRNLEKVRCYLGRKIRETRFQM